MLQSAMFFALGACFAGLLALWLAPMVWRRAVRVTERRVEAAIPLSIHEIQADKDQMRADFAVQLRKVEQKSEGLQAKAAQDRVTINEQISRIDALATDRRSKAEIIAELEDRTEAQQAQLNQAREQSTQLRSDLNARDARLKERVERIRDLEGLVQRHDNDGNAARIELAALETRSEDVAQKLRSAVKAIQTLKETNSDQKRALREQQTALKKLQRERDKALREVDRFRSNVIDLEERLDRRKAELARLKGQPAPASVAGSARKEAAAQKAASKSAEQNNATTAATRTKVAAAKSNAPAAKTQRATVSIEKQLTAFQADIEALGGVAPKSKAQRSKLMAKMDRIATDISVANDDASDVSGLSAPKKLKGFKKPNDASGLSTSNDADNDHPNSLTGRIKALHNLPAAE